MSAFRSANDRQFYDCGSSAPVKLFWNTLQPKWKIWAKGNGNSSDKRQRTLMLVVMAWQEEATTDCVHPEAAAHIAKRTSHGAVAQLMIYIHVQVYLEVLRPL